MEKSRFSISSSDKKLVISILEKIKEKEGKDKVIKLAIISFDSFFDLLTQNEKKLVKRIQEINPCDYGFKGHYLGEQNIPKNLIVISNQKYKFEGKIKKIKNQYLPKKVFNAYIELNKALYKDSKKKLLIESGYRSPAYQMIVFLKYFNFYKFNFSKTLKRVALPGYSEHSYPQKQAVDFITAEGIPQDESSLDFTETNEYKWLLKNAHRFGFYQSYPYPNKLGIIFESWHWQFRK